MLAKHGPWSHHVRVKDLAACEQAETWLRQSGKVENQDYEVLIESIEHRNTKKVLVSPSASMTRRSNPTRPRLVTSVEPILFLNDISLVTYIKLTWGGR